MDELVQFRFVHPLKFSQIQAAIKNLCQRKILNQNGRISFTKLGT